MDGKYSLKHLYNNGKSSQIKVKDFIEMINWLDQNANGMIDEAVEVTEKIDGSSNFIGYDGRIFVEKFGFNTKFYADDAEENPYFSAKAHALLDFANSIPELPEYFRDLCKDNNCSSVKVQIEVLMTKFSKMPDVCQIVLVPYELNKLGKDGNGFIIQVLNGDTLKPIQDEKIAIETLCDIMSTENFHVTGTNPKKFDPIDIKEDIQEVKDIIATYTEKMGRSVEEILSSRKKTDAEIKAALKTEIEAVQEALQDKLSEAFPRGDYGEYYEGLVFKLTNGMMFKVTSKKFKQFMASHNHWTENMKFTEAENLSVENLEELPIYEIAKKYIYKLSSNDTYTRKKPNNLSSEDIKNELIKIFNSTDKKDFYALQTKENDNSIYVSRGSIISKSNDDNSTEDFAALSVIKDFSNVLIRHIASNLGLKIISLKVSSTVISDIFENTDNTSSLKNSRVIKNVALLLEPKKIEGASYAIISENTATPCITLIKKVDNDYFTIKFKETGGKQEAVWYILNKEFKKTTSKHIKLQGTTNTDIQECIAGILIYDKLLKNENILKQDIKVLLEDDWLTFDPTTTFGDGKYQLKITGNESPKENILKFRLMVNSFLTNDWKKSMEEISKAKNIKLTVPIENPILIRSGITLVKGNSPELEALEDILFKAKFFKDANTKVYRDEVNPSDIYILNSEKTHQILNYFNCLNIIKSKAYYKLIKTFIELDKPLDKNKEEFIKELSKALPNNDIENVKDEIFELSKSQDIIDISNEPEININKKISFVIIHNFLTQKGYLAGISLKKIKDDVHFTFTGGENFFTLVESVPMKTFARSRFIFSNDPNNCTIKNCTINVSKGNTPDTQSSINIICKVNKSHLTGEKNLSGANNIDTATISIRSNGNGFALESTLGSAGAQMGKGTNAFDNLVSQSSMKKDLLHELVNIGINTTNPLLKEALQSDKVLQSLIEEYTIQDDGSFLKLEPITFDRRTNCLLPISLLSTPKFPNGENPYLNFWQNLESLTFNPNAENPKNIRMVEYALHVFNFLLGNIPFNDDNLQQFSDFLVRASKETRSYNGMIEVYSEDLRFRLTMLFAKAFKYQVFINDDYQFYNLKTGEIDAANSWNSEYREDTSLFRNYIKSHINSTIVAYYKIS